MLTLLATTSGILANESCDEQFLVLDVVGIIHTTSSRFRTIALKAAKHIRIHTSMYIEYVEEISPSVRPRNADGGKRERNCARTRILSFTRSPPLRFFLTLSLSLSLSLSLPLYLSLSLSLSLLVLITSSRPFHSFLHSLTHSLLLSGTSFLTRHGVHHQADHQQRLDARFRAHTTCNKTMNRVQLSRI